MREFAALPGCQCLGLICLLVFLSRWPNAQPTPARPDQSNEIGANPQLIRQWEAGVLAAQIQREPQWLAQVKAPHSAPTWSTLAPHDEYLPPIRGGRAGKFQQLRLKTQLYLAPDRRLC